MLCSAEFRKVKSTFRKIFDGNFPEFRTSGLPFSCPTSNCCPSKTKKLHCDNLLS